MTLESILAFMVNRQLSRREFIKDVGILTAGAVMVGDGEQNFLPGLMPLKKW